MYGIFMVFQVYTNYEVVLDQGLLKKLIEKSSPSQRDRDDWSEGLLNYVPIPIQEDLSFAAAPLGHSGLWT
jgi:hypothetical protein